MAEKIVIIGSNSFSGANFIDYLLEHDIEVIGISRSAEISDVFLPYKSNKKLNSYKFYKLDQNTQFDEIVKVINDFKPDYIVNFAAQGMVAESWQKPEHWFQTNTVSHIRLHDRLRTSAFIKKYVHVSTPEVYGTCEGLIKEHTCYNPSTPYAVSKAACDLSLMTFFKSYNFPVCFTRSANVFGSGQQLFRIIPRTILFFLIGKKLQLHGGGHSVRSFIHIRDVADGTLRVARKATPPEIFHFSTTRNISIRSAVELIAKMTGVSFEKNVEIVADRPGKDAAYLLDSSKAKDILGWKDRITLEQGIEETIKWVKDNLETLKKQNLNYIHKQ
ncbi:MAG: GDP-mannose 4,6-dehydratase [Elusimicrobia bacterium]|nr:GDP-mannose 4,6-dehydratase [Candidatus Liberimonas magnetica]